ncbi:MAG: isoprenylcysteine carboxylmethyltransferase family protein [Armatimonadetes bacterium]|nr:isoprenylcysteine carboxylmethyltransferase family protein [Armatimonadota bacterium]
MSATTDAGHAGMCRTGGLFNFVMFKQRGKLLVLPLLAVLFVTYRETESDLLTFGLGGVVFGIGLALRVWAQMHLRFRLRTSMNLTVTGPYAYIRNPVYVGNVFMACGLCVGAELLWMAPFVFVWCALFYTFVVRYEEASLTERYGEEYVAYVERVPRWFPKLGGAESRTGASALNLLRPSLQIECLTLLYWVPVVLKEVLPRWLA